MLQCCLFGTADCCLQPILSHTLLSLVYLRQTNIICSPLTEVFIWLLKDYKAKDGNKQTEQNKAQYKWNRLCSLRIRKKTVQRIHALVFWPLRSNRELTMTASDSRTHPPSVVSPLFDRQIYLALDFIFRDFIRGALHDSQFKQNYLS